MPEETRVAEEAPEEGAEEEVQENYKKGQGSSEDYEGEENGDVVKKLYTDEEAAEMMKKEEKTEEEKAEEEEELEQFHKEYNPEDEEKTFTGKPYDASKHKNAGPEEEGVITIHGPADPKKHKDWASLSKEDPKELEDITIEDILYARYHPLKEVIEKRYDGDASDLEMILTLYEISDAETDITKKELRRIYKNIENYLKESGYTKQKLRAGERIRGFFRAASYLLQGTFDISFGKELEARMTNTTKKSLKHGDQVIAMFHGMWQNNGSMRIAAKYLRSQGFKVITVGYDYNMKPEEAADLVIETAKEIHEKTGIRPDVIGHSTGANNVLYAAHRGGGSYIRKAIAISPSTNGIVLRKIAQRMIGGIPPSDSPYHIEGRESIIELNTPSSMTGRTTVVAGRYDSLVNPTHAAIDINAYKNIIVDAMGHVDGAGGRRDIYKLIEPIIRGSRLISWEPDKRVYGPDHTGNIMADIGRNQLLAMEQTKMRYREAA